MKSPMGQNLNQRQTNAMLQKYSTISVIGKGSYAKVFLV